MFERSLSRDIRRFILYLCARHSALSIGIVNLTRAPVRRDNNTHRCRLSDRIRIEKKIWTDALALAQAGCGRGPEIAGKDHAGPRSKQVWCSSRHVCTLVIGLCRGYGIGRSHSRNLSSLAIISRLAFEIALARQSDQTCRLLACPPARQNDGSIVQNAAHSRTDILPRKPAVADTMKMPHKLHVARAAPLRERETPGYEGSVAE